jgi:arsenical pump membrane protein
MIHLPLQNSSALVIGVDLGPILSITGSLATLLWLIAVRREGEHLSAIQFLLLGMVMIPPALIGALAALSVVTK